MKALLFTTVAILATSSFAKLEQTVTCQADSNCPE